MDPESPVQGIVIDNFVPHLVDAYFYSYNTMGNDEGIIDYEASWVDGEPNPALEREIHRLEQLLTDIRNQTLLAPYTGVDGVEQWSNVSTPPNSGLSDPGNQMPYSSPMMEGTEIGPNPALAAYRIDPVQYLQMRIDSLRSIDYAETRYLLEEELGYLDESNMGVAVLYSEPMMETNAQGQDITDHVWLTAEVGPKEVWNSIKYGDFTPMPSGYWPSELDIPEPDWSASRLEQSEGYWRVYEYTGPLPTDFVGRLTLNLGSKIYNDCDGPLDLAGNPLDGNPETVSAKRLGYGPWMWHTDDTVPGYEPKIDSNYSWGVPHWIRQPNPRFVNGYVEDDLIAEVDLRELGFYPVQHEYEFFGDCPFWCGFWQYNDRTGALHCDVQVVNHDGSVQNFPFILPYPVGKEHHFDLWPCWHYHNSWSLMNLSPDGRYCWFSGTDYSDGDPWNVSTAHIYVIDCETGWSYSQPVCTGFTNAWEGSLDRHMLWASWITILDVDAAGYAWIKYQYHTTWDPLNPTIEYALLPPPTADGFPGSADTGVSEAAHGDDMSMTEIRILSNPTDSSIEIVLPEMEASSVDIKVFDITGRIVLMDSDVQTSSESMFSIDSSLIPPGVYYVAIEGDSISEMMTVTVLH